MPLEDLLRPINERIEEFSGRVGGEDKVATLTKLRDSVQRVLGGPEGEALDSKLEGLTAGSPEHEAALSEHGYIKRSPTELAEHLRANPELLSKPGPLGIEATHIAPELGHGAEPGMVSIQRCHRAAAARSSSSRSRRARASTPNLRVQLLRDVSGRVEPHRGEGPQCGQQERGRNRGHPAPRPEQELPAAQDCRGRPRDEHRAVRDQLPNLSLTDYLAGAAHAPGMLLAGHPVAAAGALGLSVAHKALRAHGNAYAALMLDRLSTFGGASAAVHEFDEGVDKAIDVALSGKRASMPRAFHTSGGDSESRLQGRGIQRVHSRWPPCRRGLIGAHLQDRTAPIATHMPQTAAAMQTMAKGANAYLASNLPPAPIAQPSMTPQLDKTTVSAPDRAKFLPRRRCRERRTARNHEARFFAGPNPRPRTSRCCRSSTRRPSPRCGPKSRKNAASVRLR